MVTVASLVAHTIATFEKRGDRVLIAGLVVLLSTLGYLLVALLCASVLLRNAYLLMGPMVIAGGLSALWFFIALILGFRSFVLATVRQTDPAYKVIYQHIISWRPLQALGMFIFFWIGIILAYLCFIIPGLILESRWYLSSWVLVDQHRGAIGSLKESNRLVQHHGGIPLLLIFFEALFIVAFLGKAQPMLIFSLMIIWVLGVPVLSVLGAQTYVALLEEKTAQG